ncbi:ER membrane protein complex subunit 7 homolog [Daphnia pulex]|uniref:ER membrane protein complex subunit 7 beta-sandwich domain-containing protein n=1 Tax=Daphnia pulex TaxID=6669 RepID=E9G009_DAPPU|nr:ER membrane protein complex subunit 7 homolog [Daphnia pulex]EFX87168.1 hypothetical protein DAPPUDRAFT_307115 [Daphnia pulex]|eukprot:EFX87168.1 hypothetical protein DAPPUDRAFT_307115 [Daphnia pulex]
MKLSVDGTFLLKLICLTFFVGVQSNDGETSKEWFKIEGKVQAPDAWARLNPDWKLHTYVLIDGGEYRAFLRDDASFSVSVPSGSYVVEVSNPTVFYEPVRVDINSKGKFRARRINHIQPSAVSQMTYPLKFKPGMPYRYFQQREQWRITDLLFSPMVLMMFLPLILIFILPKMMNDPETRKEMENIQMPKYEMPEMSEMLTSLFGGGDAKKTTKSSGSKGVVKRK